MRRKILVVEATDTVRAIAETVLRQNGYEVIAVSEPDRAQEVLEFSRPDLVVISADVRAANGLPYYEKVRQDAVSATIPMLLFEPADKSALDFPEEVIIPQPFDPRDFLARVGVFIGQGDAKPAAASADNPLSSSPVDDEFLDAALGLDRIDVTESEVMDNTVIRAKKVAVGSGNNSTGLSSESQGNDSLSDSSKVESLMIQDDTSQIRHKKQVKRAQPKIEGTGKLEILDDQFGMNEAEIAFDEPEDQVHDYDWFVQSMQTDKEAPAKPTSPPVEKPRHDEVDTLTFDEPSAAVDPITPPPSQPAQPQAGDQQGAGVEKFIDEFKKEIEQLRDGETDSLEMAVRRSASETHSGDDIAWDEELEDITPRQLRLFTQAFAEELGHKIAQMVIEKIDADKLLHLLKTEILKRRDQSS